MQNFDYYGKALELSELLKKEGKNDEGDSLREAIIAGCTSTEILVNLRHCLLFIIKLEDISSTAKGIAVDLYNRIDKVLKE